MADSKLVSHEAYSPNYSSRDGNVVTKFTPHHMAGNLSVEVCGNVFAPASRQASSTYGIGSDGRIAQYVPEGYRPWTSGNYNNDVQAITVEVANDGGAPEWHVSDAAIESLINLGVDVCQRHGIRMNYTGDANGSLTRHNMFQATSCPGPYLQSKFPYIAEEINRRLDGGSPSTVEPSQPSTVEPGNQSVSQLADRMMAGDFGNGSDVRRARMAQEGYYNYEEVQAEVDRRYYRDAPTPVAPTPTPSGEFYVGQTVTIADHARLYATGEAIPASYRGHVDTILQIGNNRILLKGIMSWVYPQDLVGGSAPTYVAPAPSNDIYVGALVYVTNPVDTNGTSLGVSGTYEVMEMNSENAVIGRGGVVTARISLSNIALA